MGLLVTDVSFSLAKTVKAGSCGFCRVILNDSIAINRIKVSKSDDEEFHVILPRSDKSKGENATDKPIVQLLNEDTIKEVRDAVLKQYHQLIEDNNGFYKQKSKFSKRELVGN